MPSYGTVGQETQSPAKRAPGRITRAALIVAAVASLALVGIAFTASRAISTAGANILLDKQQAAWRDGVTVYQEDHDARLYSRGRGGDSSELRSIDNKLMALQTLDSEGDSLMHPVASHQLNMAPGKPFCFAKNGVDAKSAEAARRMTEAADNLALSYPGWAKGVSLTGKGQSGEWRHDRGPPYVMRVTLFDGDGVDTKGSGTLVRRILGLKTGFGKPCDLRSCLHAWDNNNFMSTFDGPQFRFLYRNVCSVLVVPPLTNGAGPILSDNGRFRLHHFLNTGHNTMIVLGSVANVLFLNQNYVDREGGLSLDPDWVDGPYEAQDTRGESRAKGTPFEALAVTLPGPGTSVVGVKVSSLPDNAISYYEAQDVSVVFEIPTKEGRILYMGYDFSEPVTPWVHALVAATNFPDYDPNNKDNQNRDFSVKDHRVQTLAAATPRQVDDLVKRAMAKEEANLAQQKQKVKNDELALHLQAKRVAKEAMNVADVARREAEKFSTKHSKSA